MDFALFAMAFNLKKMCKITQKQGKKKLAEYVYEKEEVSGEEFLKVFKEYKNF